jgi:hypothetical protein
MTLGAKEPDLVRGGTEGLQAIEDRLPVVQDDRRGLQRKRTIGLDAGVIPANVGGIIDQQHVVGEDLAEPQLVIGDVWFGRLATNGTERHHTAFLSRASGGR